MNLHIVSVTLREEYKQSFFDYHHAAAALENDGKIISTNQQDANISNLEVLDPAKII